MSDIESLPNLGPTTATWLRAAGVPTIETLRRIGPLEAYQRCALDGRAVALTLLYALEAGLQGRHWLDLTTEERNRLRRERDALEGDAPARRTRSRR
jgi:DNA transformation protein